LDERVAAILISGDIAFQAKRPKFDFATNWLHQLAERCGVTLASVFTCPGNHDIERGVARSPSIKALHQAVIRSDELARDATISGLFRDPNSRNLMLSP
jgi:DNA repair exonuclease SbcCD nuclease subunit